MSTISTKWGMSETGHRGTVYAAKRIVAGVHFKTFALDPEPSTASDPAPPAAQVSDLPQAPASGAPLVGAQ